MFERFGKIAIVTSILIVVGVQANSLDLPIDSEGNEILSIDEKIYNGELIKSIKYMDKDDKIHGKTVNKDGKKIDPSLLVSKDKSLFSKNLKKMLKADYGDLNFISNDEVLEVVISLPHDNIELNLEQSQMEVSFKNGKEVVKLNGKKIDKKTLEEKQKDYMIKLDKAREKQVEKIRKKIEVFAKRNGLENDSAILEAFENARSSIKLKLTKDELEKFATKNKDLIVGIELVGKPSEFLGSAMLDTNIDDGALSPAYPSRKGGGIGIYMGENYGCPSLGTIYIPSNYTRLYGSDSTHSDVVGAIMRSVSPYSYIYCRSGATLPLSTDITSYYSSSSNPRVYVENYTWGESDEDNDEYRYSDRDLDNHIYNKGVISFLAAGNGGDTTETNPYVGSGFYKGYVFSPAKALNAITVGNYDDVRDELNITSSFKDSQIGNNKPEIVAPGYRLNVKDYTEQNGTSFSVPHAAGFAADLMSAVTSFKLKPHLIKAAILAGATKVIKNRYGAVADEDKVGVGGIDFDRTINNFIYSEWPGSNDSFSYYAMMDSEPTNGRIDWNVYLYGGKDTRITISWLNTGSYTHNHRTDAYPMGMDLDLFVYDSNNNLVGFSSSYYNSYEVVNFTPSSSGYYRVSISRFANRDTQCDLKLGAAITWE